MFKNISKQNPVFYLITDLDNNKLSNLSEYKETEIIINNEVYA